MKRLFAALALLCLFLPVFAFSQTYSLSPVPKMQFLDQTGQPLAGGLVYTYTAGTNTQLVTYKDSGGTANTDPIVLDSGGFADIWLPVRTAYKFCVNDANNVQLYCVDNIENTQIGSAADIIALFSGTCNFTTWLRGDGVCATPAGGGNLSSVGLTANYMPIATGLTSLVDGPLLLVPDASPTLAFLTVGGASDGVLDLRDNVNSKAGALTIRVPAGGTVTNQRLYKIDNSGNAVAATTSDTQTTVYIGRQQYSGLAQLVVFGVSPCDFDGAPTAGDVVVTSTSTAGKCHDVGSTVRPQGAYVLGVVQGGISGSTASVLITPSYASANGVGNVGTSGLTTTYIPVATNTAQIENSHIAQVDGASAGPNYYYLNDQTALKGSNLIVGSPRGTGDVGGFAISQLLFASGETANRLVKLNTSSQWAAATTGDTDVAVFPVVISQCPDGVGSCGYVQLSGIASIDDDSTGCTPGNIVVASTTSAAKVHDTGSTAPSGTVFVVGLCVVGNGTDTILLMPHFN